MLKPSRLLLLLSMLLFAQSAAEAKHEKERFIETTVKEHVGVLFATDRRQALPRDSDASDLSFKEQEIEDINRITYGIIDEETVRKITEPSPSESCAEGSAQATKLPDRRKPGKQREFEHVEATSVPSTDTLELPEVRKSRTMEPSEFADTLKQISLSSERGVVINVHGCCLGFERSAEDAALTSAWLKMPVILYDWGSRPGGYAGSLQAAARSQERFNTFMENVTKQIPPERITLLGFSLGSKLIVEHCLQSSNKAKFKDIILARPDLDVITFKSHIPRVLSRTEQLHLYLAKNDFILHCSGGLRRIASPYSPCRRVGVATDDFTPTPHVTILDVSHVDPLHAMPNEVMADLMDSASIPEHSSSFNYEVAKNGIINVLRR